MRLRRRSYAGDGSSETALRSAPRRVPASALVISAAALAVPSTIVFGWVDPPIENDGLLWLLALVPAFLLSFYRGWKGAAVAIAVAMAVFAVSHAVLAAAGFDLTDQRRSVELLVVAIVIAMAIGMLAELLRREAARIQRLALTDDLTDMPNRRFAEFYLRNQFAAALRGRDIAVVLFDLDDFKAYNDRHGHGAGDEVLRAVGAVFRTVTRDMDLSGRWGGEEFLTVLTDCTGENAVLFAERVREQVAALVLTSPVTVSAGVAGVRAGMMTELELVGAADRALYQAKLAGRNRVCLDRAADPPAATAAAPDDDLALAESGPH